MKQTLKAGFSLLELAIVLVVIGLLALLVLSGTNFIESAKLQNSVKQIQAIDAGINLFQSRFNGIPGDLRKAIAMGIVKDGITPPATDGDGDGRIETASQNASGTLIAPDAFTYETALVFEQLTASGIINGDYEHPTGSDVNAGVHVPGIMNGDVPLFVLYAPDIGGNMMFIGSGTGVGATTNISSLFNGTNGLTPSQALELDAKLDDGDPSSGLFRVVNSSTPFDGTAPATGPNECLVDSDTYNASLDVGNCDIRIKPSGI